MDNISFDRNSATQSEKLGEMTSILSECKVAATTGYNIATKHERQLNKTLTTAEEMVRNTLLSFTSSPCYSPETTSLLQGQLLDIEQAFMHLSFAFREDLENLKGNLSKFSITLFGRTMAGKSTLMEILTEGNGESIGKGAQRTTRDIRKYTWNMLEITDVPGIGAFEGEEDEQIAFQAAKTADLILFLITDDAPQAVDAECFSRIISLGKPVICVMNVKASMAEGKSIKLITRDVAKKFSNERLDTIRNQFLSYAERFGQSWSHIPFVYVHLKSAFMAQHEPNPETADIYYQMSKIHYLKDKIQKLVASKGRFLRIKTFIDIISNPMIESMERLLDQSRINSMQGRTILSKRRQLCDWKDSFYRDSKSQISSLLIKIKSDLHAEIAAFTEEHYNDQNADKAWNRILKERQIEKRCQDLLDECAARVTDRLTEFSREITNELNFTTSFANDKTLKMKSIIDTKKVWDWSSLVVGSGLSIAAGIAYLLGATVAGPLGWAALVASGIGLLGSFLFRSRDSKELEARLALEKNLKDNVSKICDSLEKQMNKSLNILMDQRIHGLLSEIDKINSVIFGLADTQRELAWDLNEHLLELNREIVAEALKLVDAGDFIPSIRSVARIPGNSSVFLLRDGAVFPEEKRNEVYKMMAERINFVFESQDKKVLISRVLGKTVDRWTINLEEKIGVAHIPLPEPTPALINRMRLAQQFSRVQIIKQ